MPLTPAPPHAPPTEPLPATPGIQPRGLIAGGASEGAASGHLCHKAPHP